MRGCATTTVPVPVARVWEVVADHEGMSRWAPGMKASLLRPGDTERNGVGAQRRLQPLPLMTPFVEEITAFEPERRMAYRAVSGIPFRNYAAEIELRPSAEGTGIVYTVSADNRLPGVAAAIAYGLLFALKRQVVNRNVEGP